MIFNRSHKPGAPRILLVIRDEMMLICEEYYLMGRTDAMVAHSVKQEDPLSDMFDPHTLAMRIALLGKQLAHKAQNLSPPAFHYPSFFDDHHQRGKGYPIRGVKLAIEMMLDEVENLRKHPELQRRIRISDMELAMVAQMEYMRGVLEGLYIEGGMESPHLGPDLPTNRHYNRRITLISDTHLFIRLLEHELGARPEEIVRYQTIHPRFLFAWSKTGVQVLEIRDDGEDDLPDERLDQPET